MPALTIRFQRVGRQTSSAFPGPKPGTPVKGAGRLSHLKVEGVACHIGSQITDSKPFNDAFAKVTNLARELQADGFALKRIDLGGGLGITYKDENPIGISDYAALVMQSRASAGPPAFPRAGPLRLRLGRGANLRRFSLSSRSKEKALSFSTPA